MVPKGNHACESDSLSVCLVFVWLVCLRLLQMWHMMWGYCFWAGHAKLCLQAM